MREQTYLYLGAGDGECFRFLDDSKLIIKTPGDSADNSLAHYEYIARPAARGSPQHVHHGHDETFYVVAGQFEFTLGSISVSAEAGSFLLVKRGQPHAFRNSGTSEGRIVGTFSAGFAQYFRELGRILEETGAPPNMKDWAQLYGRYGTTFYDPQPVRQSA